MQRVWVEDVFAQLPAKVLRRDPDLGVEVKFSVRALPVKVPEMFLLCPSDGNEPEYLVGMSPTASAATVSVATTAADNRYLRILRFPNLGG